ncbi:retrovirus-related pol polyprotein from transposon TNT 1-94, partial [Tanacetum coccineum]
MANLSEDIQCAGSDTRPPMLDKADFASWQQRIRLYCRGKDNGVNILKSIDEGPFQMGTTRGIIAEGTEGPINLGPERPRVYSELSQDEKDRYNADIRATNIILQGLPKDIYSLINHYTDAKDIWDNVKMLLEGSELTKEDRESQLYDDFEHFRQNKGETIHNYYVRFAKLINDMRNIKMTMSKIQLNSKFVNNMLPEWGRFVTAVKLNKGLKDSNFDQLYAYLKQHEAHANENKMMLERLTQQTVDPLALMSNVSPQHYHSQSSTNPPTTYHQPHWLPLSTFLVDILRHFRINISQLSVIGAAKVSHFEILYRVYGIIPTVGLFRCFFVNSKKSGWISFSKLSNNALVDDFACPISFPWHTARHVTRDPAPVVADFNAQDYATLVTHPSLFRKFPKEFLCLVRLSRHYTLDEETYPRFLHKNKEGGLKVVERERNEDKPLLLETTIGRTVSILPVAPDHAESELDASVEKLFDEGEDIQCAGSDTRPPMLDKADFASWQQRIRLYCRGKDNGVNILKSIDEGPFQMGTTRGIVAEGTEGSLNLGPERPRVYSDLSQDEKDRYNADIRATNIILQGLPKDIYSLINHYTDAKDIWDNVKMLLEGSELTKEDRESQLYDDFEHFRQNKGETIHNYYVRFAKLINDMRNIKMTMSKIQLNSKFVNNMLPEWGRFVTAVKLNKGLKDSNFDQLYAYLKQHETHANENKMMLERLTQQTVDPLALMSNVSPQLYHSQSSTNPPTTHHQPQSADSSQSELGLSPTDNLIENLTNTLALLTQSYKTFLPQTNNQLRTSSNPRNQATVQDGRVVVQNVQGRQNRGQGNNARGAGAVGYGRAQNRVGNANPGQARQVKCYNCNGVGHIARNCTQPKRPQNSEYFKDKMLLMQAQENGVALDEEQLLFLAGGQDYAIDEDVDEQPVQDLALNVDNVFQADDCDAYDSDVDEAPTAQTLFMANLSSADPVYDEAGPSYDSDVLSEVQDHDHYQDAVCDHHDEHEMHDDVQPNHVVDSHADYTSDSNMTPYDQYVKDNAVPVVQNNASMVPNDAYVMIDNDLHESDVLSVSHTPRNTVVNNSLNAELATYKEQVELYERRARFELTEREQKIDEQLRIVICDRNIKEENLKKELHSVKLQLASTIQHNKLMVDEVTSLKKDFNQKENKYLEEFLDLKALKDKVEDKLFKQGQSIQTVHMMCKPRSYYDEVNKVAIGYKNPLCLHRARKVQPALYSGHV